MCYIYVCIVLPNEQSTLKNTARCLEDATVLTMPLKTEVPIDLDAAQEERRNGPIVDDEVVCYTFLVEA